MLPINGVLPNLPEADFHLPSVRDIDRRKKHKVLRAHRLPSLGYASKNKRKADATKQAGDTIYTAYKGITDTLYGPTPQPVENVIVGTSELDELLQIVDFIENECLANIDSNATQDEDLFIKTQHNIEQLIQDTEYLIRKRQMALETSGTTYETIKLRAEISNNVDHLKQKFNAISEIYSSQARHKKKLNFTDEILEERRAVLSDLLKDIESVWRQSKGYSRKMSQTKSQKYTNYNSLIDSNQNKLGVQPQVLNDVVIDKPSEQDQIVMNRWKERDQQFDEQIEDIGNAIDRIANTAGLIGDAANQDIQMIESLEMQTDAASHEIQLLNAKLRQFIKSKDTSNFCCRIILLLILILLICFVFTTVYARYIKKA